MLAAADPEEAAVMWASASITSCAQYFSAHRWASTGSHDSPFAREIDVVNVDILDQMARSDGKYRSGRDEGPGPWAK